MALTLIKDERNQVPLAVRARREPALPLGARLRVGLARGNARAGRSMPELKKRWPNLTAVEVTDRTTASEYELIRALTRRADAVVAGVFVRIASFSGRMDLSQPQIALLDSVAAQDKPFVTVCFGNPYTATFLPKLPAVLLDLRVLRLHGARGGQGAGRGDPDRRQAADLAAGHVPGRPRADSGGEIGYS